MSFAEKNWKVENSAGLQEDVSVRVHRLRKSEMTTLESKVDRSSALQAPIFEATPARSASAGQPKSSFAPRHDWKKSHADRHIRKSYGVHG